MKTPIQDEFDHGEGPGVIYPVVWLLVAALAVGFAVVIVKCAP